MKSVKIFFSILVLLILLAVVALGSLLFLMDPNKLKPVLIAETKKYTGYQLAIAGPLSWTFYPHIAIKIDGMTLSEPNQSPFIELRGVRLAMELSQLLRGNEKWQGKVLISSMKLMNVRAEKVSTNVHWEDHVLTLQPIHASLYDGSLSGSANGRDLSTASHWQWNVKFSDIQIQPFLQDINGPNSKIKISGVGQVNLQANTQGKTRDQILSNMNGSGDFSLNNGIVQGIDLNYLVQTANALLNKQTVTPPENMNQTAFSSLTGSMVIKRGVIATDNLLLTSPAFTTKGKGTVGLLTEALNLNLLIAPVATEKNPWQIPVLVTGEMNHPNVRLDTTDIEKFVSKQQIDKLKTKAAEKIKEHIHGKAGEFLQNLLSK